MKFESSKKKASNASSSSPYAVSRELREPREPREEGEVRSDDDERRKFARRALAAKRRTLAHAALPLLKVLRKTAAALLEMEMDAEMDARTCLMQHGLPSGDGEYCEENYGECMVSFEQSHRFASIVDSLDVSIMFAAEAVACAGN